MMSEAHRDAISRGQAERHRRQREALEGAPEPDTKVCTRCHERLPISDFRQHRRVRKSDGAVVRYPYPQCRACNAARRRENDKKNFIEKYGEAEWRRRVASRVDRARKNRSARDRYRLQAADEGRPYRTWGKYANEIAGGGEVRVPMQPFAEWWEEQPIWKLHKIRDRDMAVWDSCTSSLRRATETINLPVIDQVSELIDEMDLIAVLYPLTS